MTGKGKMQATAKLGGLHSQGCMAELLHGGEQLQTLPKSKFSSIFCYFFGLFSKYLAPSGAKYREKGWAVAKIGEG